MRPLPRAIATVAILLLVVGAGRPAAAEEVRLGVRNEVKWTDNLFSESEDPVDDYSLRTTPWLEVRDPKGRLQWNFRYQPSWEGYLDTEDVEGWDHRVSGTATLQVGPVTELEVRDSFARFQSISSFNEQIEDDFGETIAVDAARRDRFKKNDFTASVQHRLAPDQRVTLRFQHQLFDFSTEGRDRTSFGLTAQYQRELTERLAVGLGLGWTRQVFEGAGEADDQDTDFYNLSGILSYDVDPTLSFDVSAGPTLVDGGSAEGFPATFQDVALEFPRRRDPDGVVRLLSTRGCRTTDSGRPFLSDSCQTVQGVSPSLLPLAERVDLPFLGEETSGSDSRVTFFADASVTKIWERWRLRLSYRRQDSTSSGLGTSTIADTVNLNLTYTPSPRWTFRLGGAWIRQEQSTDSVQPVVLLASADAPLTLRVDFGGTVLEFPAGTVTAARSIGVGGVERDSDFEQTNIVFNLDGTYRLTRRVKLFARLFYIDVSREGGGVLAEDYDRFTAGVGFVYEFDPFRI